MDRDGTTAGFLDAFPDPTWTTDAAGVVLVWNPAAERTFSVPAADAVGRSALDLLGAGLRPGTLDRTAVPAVAPVCFERPGRDPVRGSLTTWHEERAGGRLQHCSLRVTVGESVAVARRPLEELLEHVSDSIITVDPEGIVLSLNRGAERTWGVKAADLVGRHVSGLNRNSARTTQEYLASMAETLQRGRTWHGVEMQCTTHAGRQLLVDSSATPLLDAAGSYAGAILVSRDITPVRELEQSLRAATRALRDRAGQAARTTHRDALTGVAERSLLQERLAAELSAAVESGEPVSVLAADLDGFRAVNDSYGLAAGDAVLIAFAAHLRSHLPPSATAGRLGADVFAVVLPGATAQDAAAIADRIAGWTPPSPLPTRGRRGDDEPVGVTLGVVQASLAECRSSFDTGVRSVLVRAEGILTQTKAARRGRTPAARSAGPVFPGVR